MQSPKLKFKIEKAGRVSSWVWVFVIVAVGIGVYLLRGGDPAAAQLGPEITCQPTEYACWGNPVPEKIKQRCDDVFEREITVCEGNCDGGGSPGDGGSEFEVDDSGFEETQFNFYNDPLNRFKAYAVVDPGDGGSGPIPNGDGGDDECKCKTVTEYSCELCLEGKIFPYPVHPGTDDHGSADKCPTGEDPGQHDGTGSDDPEDDKAYLWYDYDRGVLVNVPPIQFGNIPPPPLPTATPPVVPFPTTPVVTLPSPPPTDTPAPGDPPDTPGPDPTATSTPVPVSPANTPTLGPSPSPVPDAACGWPIGPNTGSAEFNMRRVTGWCDTGDYPEDGNLIFSSGHEYPAIDIGTGPLGSGGQPTVQSTQEGTAYWCVENNVQVGNASYGVYVIVNGESYSSMYAHLDADPGAVSGYSGPTNDLGLVPQPGDGECQPSAQCYEPDHCLLQSRTVNQGEALGTIGLTGRTDGYHLHYEVWDGDGVSVGNQGSRLCPANFMDYTAQACGGSEPNAFNFLNRIFARAAGWVRGILDEINPYRPVLAQDQNSKFQILSPKLSLALPNKF